MLPRKKVEGSTEKKAIHILLDCSNTLRLNKPEEREEEVLSPWAGRHHPHNIHRNLKLLKKSSFITHTTPHRQQHPKHLALPHPFTPHSLRHKPIFEQTVCLSKKVVNLSEQFEEIYQKRRESFVRQHHLRLKTVA